MPARDFFTPDTQSAVRKAVADAEALTSAELVVAVRRVSGRYREADYLCGFVVALCSLAALLYLPQPFPLWVFVPNVVVGFVIGALVASRSAAIRRLLTPRASLDDNVRRAARALFHHARYSRLPARNAVLIYVALLERRVDIIADLGIDTDALEPDWSMTCRALDEALGRRPDVQRFLMALRRLGPLLGRAYPRQVDDVNELADEVRAS
jgi:putative membrane protein